MTLMLLEMGLDRTSGQPGADLLKRTAADQGSGAGPGEGKRRRRLRPDRSRAAEGRRSAKRISQERLLARAVELPEPWRSLITAHLANGVPVGELAAVHGCSCRQMRRRLERVKAMLAEPLFVLTLRFGQQLPADLGRLARHYWIETRSMRELAEERGVTLHRIRSELAAARSLLLVELSRDQRVRADWATAACVGHARNAS
jgi:DNA-directed RNA polymerase specialized sigma24 family protein